MDPGDTFWTEEEIAEEQRLYGKDEANETLEKLFQVGRCVRSTGYIASKHSTNPSLSVEGGHTWDGINTNVVIDPLSPMRLSRPVFLYFVPDMNFVLNRRKRSARTIWLSSTTRRSPTSGAGGYTPWSASLTASR